MIKCFLSHSSNDKGNYVEIVAKKIGKNRCIYDSFTFEEGMNLVEEIDKRLEQASLFVIFLSKNSLDSGWVKSELEKAYKLLGIKKIRRIFPILIDPKVAYNDPRIPKWMQDEYNVKYVSRPTVAARRIIQRLREISWEFHPKIKERENIFVGRTNLLKIFEERLDSFDIPAPVCIIASGIKRIGRKSVLRQCFIKANIFDASYYPSVIELNSKESVEDFIHKVYNLGFSSNVTLENLISLSLEEKLKICLKLVADLQETKEILFIIDNGCLVTDEKVISTWFLKILDSISSTQTLTFGIASSFRFPKISINTKNYIFIMDVPELDKKERQGLLKRYADLEELSLATDDLKFLSNLLYGYPEQVYYTVALIKDIGLPMVKRNTDLIVEFNTERVNQLLQKYDNNKEAIDFLVFLSEFEVISYDLIFEIVEEKEEYKKLIEEFTSCAICEFLGANKEFLRINDTIRDNIQRKRLGLPEKYQQKLRDHVDNFIKTYQEDEKDVTDFLYSLKEALILNKSIDDKYLIPSHFVKTMKELYDKKRSYSDVVQLADRILQNEDNMDNHIKLQIRYYLCLSLARLQDKRFLEEVQKIHGPEHDFLFGFYYRLTGRYTDAIERLEAAINARHDFPRAKREYVHVLSHIEQYDKAMNYARENYLSSKNNPYHIQAYFNCLIRSPKAKDSEDIIIELLNNLKKINEKKAIQMYLLAEAQHQAFIKNDEFSALKIVEDAITKFPDEIYPKLTKFDICAKFGRIDDMKTVLSLLEKEVEHNKYFYNAFILREATYLAKTGDLTNAIFWIDSKLKNYPEEAKNKIKERVIKYGS